MTQAALRSSYKPSVYLDRAANVVRDWSTDQALPAYEGMCMVYLDLKGPVLVRTFLQNGQRCWEGME